MKTRVIVGVLLVALLLACLVFGGYLMIGFISVISVLAIHELSKVFAAKGWNPILIPAYCFAAVFGLVNHFFGLAWVTALYCCAVLATMIISVLDSKRSAGDGVISLFLFLYPILLLVTVLLNYFAFPRPLALTASAMAWAAPSFADMFAYFGGSLFGKHKLCPAISPKKTVEGSVAAILGGMIFGVLLIWLQRLWGGTANPLALVLTGTILGILAQFGDLFASKLKRWAEIKDFSALLPGHGGVMDRIDSILISSPLVLVIFTILQ